MSKKWKSKDENDLNAQTRFEFIQQHCVMIVFIQIIQSSIQLSEGNENWEGITGSQRDLEWYA